MKKNIHLFIWVFLLAIPHCLKGSEELYMSFLRGEEIAQNRSVSIALPRTNLPDWSISSSHIRAKLYLAEDRENFHGEESYMVKYKITLHYAGNGKDVFTEDLEVFYMKAGSYRDLDLRLYTNRTYTSATLNIVGVEGRPPQDLILELQIATTRVENRSIMSAPPSVTGVAGRSSGELLLTWDYSPGYESYDVEWLFIDNPSHRDGLPFDFKNATRINTGQNYYIVPLAYPKGSILFRVRGVYASGHGFATGFWSYASLGSVLPPSGTSARYDYEGLENDLNWQYSGTFAEEGKRSESITFFDGSLRNRQQVSFGNSSEIALVSENFYDHVGRPALQSLPIPTSGTGMHYYGTGGSSNGLFNGFMEKDRYDTDNKIGNSAPFPEMGGWSQYYSARSTFADRPHAVNTDHVPSDRGYLYSHTRYRNDGTDRVHSVAAPGQDFSLGSGNETRYYYGNPTQTELDRIFGNEAGDASHYQKVITVDGNYTVTVEYYDMHERLIATSLAGGRGNLLPVDGAPERRRFSETIYYDDESREDNRTISVAARSNYRFDYYFSPASRMCESCQGKQACLDCEYTIVISLWNPDQMEYVFYQTDVVNEEKNYSFDVNLSIGNYLLHKEVRVYDENLENMLRNYRTVMDRCAPYTPVPPAPCYTICEEYCMQTLNLSEPDYTKKEFTDCIEKCENPTVTYQTQCEAWYESMLRDMSPGGQYFDNITYRCPPDSLENAYDISKRNDFLKRISTATLNNDSWIRSMLSQFGIPVSDPNRHDRLWDSLRSNWNEQYAYQMFNYHPERSLYELKCACGDVSRQNDFDNLFMNTMTFKDAEADGLLNPLAMNVNPYGGLTKDPRDDGYLPFKPNIPDPYFADGKCCEKGAEEMKRHITERMNGYLFWEQGGTTYYASVWYLLIDPEGISEGGGPGVIEEVREAFRSMQTVILPEMAEQYQCGLDDARWLLFRNIYLYLREEAKEKFLSSCYYNYGFYQNPLTLDQRPWHADQYPGEALESCVYYLYAQPDCRNQPLTREGYEIRFLCNPVYNLGIDQTPEMIDISVKELTENCLEDCKAYANEWMRELQDYLFESCGISGPEDSRWQDIMTDLVNLCHQGCAENEANMDFTRRQLFREEPYRDIFGRNGCEIEGRYPLPMLVYPKEENYVDCGCNSFQEYLNTAGLNFASDPDKIYSVLEEEKIKTDVGFWTQFCMTTRYEYLLKQINDTAVWKEYEFPERFRSDCRPANEDWLSQCKENNLLAAASINFRAKEEALDGMVATRRGLYPDHCLANIKTDEMTISYENGEFLFTLYYYDQAGNLVRTVPPAGVSPLEDEGSLTQVRKYRQTVDSYENMDGFVHPGHTMVSHYRYNTLDQVTVSSQPDHDGESEIYYDILSRPVLSRNPEQRARSTYSYTLYDDQGRIIETGQVYNTSPISREDAADPVKLAAFISGSRWRTEITRTIYDRALLPALGQKNLRNRIASVNYFERSGELVRSATHYSYDFHGNVERLVQQVPGLSRYGRNMITLDYEYDLVSGNVNKLWYQKGRAEQWIHRYRYDADNRLTHVLTSRDNQTWHHDARYFYLPHGPLARTELGEKQVQGMDYAYTIRNWLKGMNSYELVVKRDIGHDGNIEGFASNSPFGYDAFGYTLQYYGKDYRPVKTAQSPFWQDYLDEERDLYNGNISYMTTTDQIGRSLLKSFRYDQLDRLVSMETATPTSSGWGALGQAYKSSYRYDFNGNLLYLQRLNDRSYVHHQVHYEYDGGRNRLNHIEAYGLNASSYQYDGTGNLIYDEGESMKIQWNASGKVRTVTNPKGELVFGYTALGQRQVKETADGDGKRAQYYLHDASGNILCIYEVKDDRLYLKEQPIYGSSRLGVLQLDQLLPVDLREGGDAVQASGERYGRFMGQRRYELPDHLGNVHVTVSDRKQEKGMIDEQMVYLPELLSSTDYYPFGYPMPSRGETTQSYRYGFNGQEKDDEVYGEGSAYDFGERIYDSRIGKWFSIDPSQVKYPGLSPYAFVANNPIRFLDIGGKDFVVSVNNSGENRTITIKQNIYPVSEEAALQLEASVKELNDLTKIVTIDDVAYTVIFEINIMPLNTTPVPYTQTEAQAIAINATNSAQTELQGNIYVGNTSYPRYKYNPSTGRNDYIGGNAGGNFYRMFMVPTDISSNPGLVQGGNFPSLLSHEILHTFGLNDLGGKYYDPKGRMSYTANAANNYKMNPISNQDIVNIIKYAIENNGIKQTDPVKANVKIEYQDDQNKFSTSSKIEIK